MSFVASSSNSLPALMTSTTPSCARRKFCHLQTPGLRGACWRASVSSCNIPRRFSRRGRLASRFRRTDIPNLPAPTGKAHRECHWVLSKCDHCRSWKCRHGCRAKAPARDDFSPRGQRSILAQRLARQRTASWDRTEQLANRRSARFRNHLLGYAHDVIGAVRQQEFLLTISVNSRRSVTLLALRSGVAGAFWPTKFPPRCSYRAPRPAWSRCK